MSRETRTCDRSPNKQHCWHPAMWHHTIPNHSDETCCWCGQSRCVNLAPPARDPQHGSYAP